MAELTSRGGKYSPVFPGVNSDKSIMAAVPTMSSVSSGNEYFRDEDDEDFCSVDFDMEIQDYVLSQKAKNTCAKDATDENTFRLFCHSIKETRNIEDIPAAELDRVLSQFFMKAKKRDGSFYEPDTLTAIRNSLQRILITRGSILNLREGDQFHASRLVLAARRKELTKLGKGNKSNASRPLESKEVDKLFADGYFGVGSPAVLQRTVWWFIT